MNLLKKLHNDEEGLEALQVVIILAIAAIIIALVKIFWGTIKSWFQDSTKDTTKDW
jgi:hypothetical protein